LLRREKRPAAEVIEHLVGLQAQEPRDPYVTLWSRIEGFRPEELENLVEGRKAVRMTLMRGTIHLVTDRDCLALRPAMQSVCERMFWSGSPFGRQLRGAGVDVDEVVAAGRAHLGEPLTRAQLRPLLAERWPDADANSLTYAVAYLVPLVQVPPRGLWSRSGRATLTTADSWLGRRVKHSAKPDDAVRRYLAAFGPASVKDIATWSGLTGVREIVERLRGLRTFRDENGVELFDVPDAPLADPDTPTPVRFLAEYDNVFLSHADRSRIVDRADRPQFGSWEGRFFRIVLVGGFIRAIWRADDGDVVVKPVRRLSKKDVAAVEAEGRRLAAFLDAGDVRILPA
jgi:Winged helix DNA-binding domain